MRKGMIFYLVLIIALLLSFLLLSCSAPQAVSTAEVESTSEKTTIDKKGLTLSEFISEYLNIIIAFIAFIALGVSVTAIFINIRSNSRNTRKEFILWAFKSLDSVEMEKSKNFIKNMTKEKKNKIIDDINSNNYSKDVMKIWSVCIVFNKIGYYIYKFRTVKYDDILQIYPSGITLALWDKIYDMVKAWRKPGPNKLIFIYFEMLVHQKRFLKRPFIFKSNSPIECLELCKSYAKKYYLNGTE